jgi:hypothetical protein
MICKQGLEGGAACKVRVSFSDSLHNTKLAMAYPFSEETAKSYGLLLPTTAPPKVTFLVCSHTKVYLL